MSDQPKVNVNISGVTGKLINLIVGAGSLVALLVLIFLPILTDFKEEAQQATQGEPPLETAKLTALIAQNGIAQAFIMLGLIFGTAYLAFTAFKGKVCACLPCMLFLATLFVGGQVGNQPSAHLASGAIINLIIFGFLSLITMFSAALTKGK